MTDTSGKKKDKDPDADHKAAGAKKVTLKVVETKTSTEDVTEKEAHPPKHGHKIDISPRAAFALVVVALIIGGFISGANWGNSGSSTWQSPWALSGGQGKKVTITVGSTWQTINPGNGNRVVFYTNQGLVAGRDASGHDFLLRGWLATDNPVAVKALTGKATITYSLCPKSTGTTKVGWDCKPL